MQTGFGGARCRLTSMKRSSSSPASASRGSPRSRPPIRRLAAELRELLALCTPPTGGPLDFRRLELIYPLGGGGSPLPPMTVSN